MIQDLFEQGRLCQGVISMTGLRARRNWLKSYDFYTGCNGGRLDDVKDQSI